MSEQGSLKILNTVSNFDILIEFETS